MTFALKLQHDKTVTIENGETVSGAVDLGGETLVGITIPTGFEGTAITFQVATAIDGTYRAWHVDGSALSITVTANIAVQIDPSDLAGARFLKLVAGTSQTGDITLTLHTRPV